MTKHKLDTRRAYSYVRFSSPEQAKGGSLKRQVEMSLAYCKRKGLALDDSLTLHDLGVSAYRGTNAKQGRLAAFLEAVRTAKVPVGSVLIVESVDRISRQGIDEGYDLCKRILKSGIHIVTLQPEREFGPDAVKALTKGALELQIVLERAHEESEMKSSRRKDGWKQARDKARAGGGPMMKTCPAWLEVTESRFRVREKAAKTVRRIFAMARGGLGVHRITERLNVESVPTIGSGARWVKAYTYRILTNAAAMGTYQPMKSLGKKSVPDGAPIPGYYPAVVAEDEWQAVQAAIDRRGGGRGAGRKGTEETNLFSGLLHCGLTRQKLHIINALGRKTVADRKRYRYLVPSRDDGTAKGERIDYAVFETAVLSLLKELKPTDVAPDSKDAKSRQAELARLTARLLDLDSRLERTQRRAQTATDFDTFLDLIEKLQAERREVIARRAELEREDDGQATAGLCEMKSLIDLMAETPPDQLGDLRRRLKVRIGQLASDIWVVIIRRGRKCVASVQMNFRGSTKERHWWLLHIPGNRYADGQWRARSHLVEEHPLHVMDLRNLDEARWEAEYLKDDMPLEIVFREEVAIGGTLRD